MNSEEIAKLAKVSRSTVSRVINNYPNVPQKTREKVQKVIDEYGYKPNASARILAGKANNIIGIFVADIDKNNTNSKWIGIKSPYNMELVVNVIERCKQEGYLTLVDVISNVNECKSIEHYFSDRMIHGGIFVGFPYRTKQIEELALKQNNIVLVDQVTDEDDQDNHFKIVNANNEKGGYMSTKYLLDKGHRDIVHIAGDDRLSSIERQAGYKKAMDEAGIPESKQLVIQGHYREEIAYSKTIELLKLYKPTAMFVANDIMALGVVRAIEDSGLHVPGDISIIGYDNLEQAEWLKLHLTTVSVNLKDVSKKCVSLLLDNNDLRHVTCDLKIIERDTVKAI